MRCARLCLGLLLVCFAHCEQKRPQPFSAGARRITDAKQWAAEQDALSSKKQFIEAEVKDELPPGAPAPELFDTTLQIYERLLSNRQWNDWEAYEELIPSASVCLKMIPIRGGIFQRGSVESESNHKKDEGPVAQVELDDFWMSEIEIPWEIYTAFMQNGRPRSKGGQLLENRPDDELWDVVTQPTAPYTSMNLGMGNGYEAGMPAIAMSHHAANKFCEWLSAQTGRYYRLPTEAEWEYACRAGTSTAYSFGDQESELKDYGWFWDNSHDRYQKVKSKKPNAWGLYDMHGNVSEWVLDSYDPETYRRQQEQRDYKNPVYIRDGAPHVVRGGSWDDDPERLRSAARRPSSPAWNATDPQNPKSIWYLTDGGTVGFRIVRPKSLPPVQKIHTWWNFSQGQP